MVELISTRTLIIPKASGRAFQVAKGQVFRVQCIDGPQVADMNVFNLRRTREAFSASFTRALMGTHVSTGHQLLSRAPYCRPMLTIVADSVGLKPSPGGAVSHDVMLVCCNRKVHELFTGRKNHPNCQDNLARVIRAHGLGQVDVHDPMNVFARTGIGQDGRIFYEYPAATRGDHMDFLAEMDCLIAISACPGKSSGPVRNRLGVEIFDLGLPRGGSWKAAYAHVRPTRLLPVSRQID
jgi:uncharacterized protein YcgI (DUF1989 family)